MKFKVNSSELMRGLSAVNGAVPNKATLPILETILFESDGEQLKLTATDLEISIIENIEGDIEEEGSVAIPAKRLLDTLRQLPDIPIHFTIDEDFAVHFHTDKGNYKLAGEDPEEFPELPDLESGTVLETDRETVQMAIDKTLFAVSNDDLRPAMMGVFFEIGTDESRFVATDGHRLVRYTRSDITADEEIEFIIPEKALNLVRKTLEDEDCNINVTDEHARFQSGNTIVITRLINEQYPNYDSVIPKENDKQMTVGKEQMLSTVKRVSIFSSSTTRQVRLQLKPDEITISAEDIDMNSEATETLGCDYDHEEMEIGFNAKYLSDVLDNVGGDEVYFEFSSPNRAGIVKPTEQEEDEELLMLVMPVMLNSYG